ncbi:MAG: hypothetical protein IPN03_18625 [Holophagales bacterium]|nr:hypothetical protein [Holophagales bacterium]
MSCSPGILTLAVLGTVVGLGILSVGAAVFSLEVRYASRTVAGLAGGLLLPLLVIGVLGFLLWSEPGSVPARGMAAPPGRSSPGSRSLASPELARFLQGLRGGRQEGRRRARRRRGAVGGSAAGG